MEDTISDFILSLAPKDIMAIGIGIVTSWYVSKYFFFKKEPSLLQRAKRDKTAGFGAYYNLEQAPSVYTLNTKFFGTWLIKTDGTVIDVENKIGWIRAPWGTIWNGKGFEGKPMTISWKDATVLFGKGKSVSYNKLKSSTSNNSNTDAYKSGSCSVEFANHKDWRLPTLLEFKTLHQHPPEPYEIAKLYEAEWAQLKAHLFSGYLSNKDYYKFWSAQGTDSHTSWMSYGLYAFSDEKINN